VQALTKFLQEQAGKLAGKWNKSGLLEGIESSTEKNNMSMLLENQAKQLVNEANYRYWCSLRW
jgi:hypothetical protein